MLSLSGFFEGNLYGQSPNEESGFQRVCIKHNIDVKGWNSQVHEECSGSFVSNSLSMEDFRMETGCKPRVWDVSPLP